MRIHLGSDHAGFPMKEFVREYLLAAGYEVEDVGPTSEASVDYPDYADEVARAVAQGRADKGVLVCGSGLGMAIAANKVHGVRAVQVTDPEMARMARRHNDANVITLAGRYSPVPVVKDILDAFLQTEFEGGRHQRRIDKITELETRG